MHWTCNETIGVTGLLYTLPDQVLVGRFEPGWGDVDGFLKVGAI